MYPMVTMKNGYKETKMGGEVGSKLHNIVHYFDAGSWLKWCTISPVVHFSGKKSGKVQTSCNPWAVLKSGMASFSPSASELWPFRTRGKPGFPFGQKSPFFPDLCGQAEDPHKTLGDIEGKTKIPY